MIYVIYHLLSSGNYKINNMSKVSIKKNINRFKKIEEKKGFKTKYEDISEGKSLLPLIYLNKKEKDKYILSTEEVFGKNWKHLRDVFSEDIIEKYSPDNIDINKFWKESVDAYPFVSICGYANVNNINEANASTLNGLHSVLGGLHVAKSIWEQNQDDFKILEIGPGYGGFHNWVKNFPNTSYYGIDVNPLFECETLYKCDGRNIPPQIPLNLDVVYSYNVFQHLTKKQRTSYYKQAYLVLKSGGVFTCSLFVVTPNNFDGHYWHMSDKDGNFYCGFFNQLTVVDRIENLQKELEEIGFEFIVVREHRNCLSFAAIKV